MSRKIQPQRSTPWIFSPPQDLAFILLTPLGILLAFAAARSGGWMDGLIAFGLAIAMAHYLPGMLRAYGDPALFHRFKVRLIAAPLFLITVTSLFAYLNLHIILLLATVWAVWHWMMQIYGFARIYDAKSAPVARTPARLDQSLCLLWFGMCALVFNNTLPTYITNFYWSGGPRLSAGVFTLLAQAWLVVTIAVTVFYLFHTVNVLRKGAWPNPLKFVLLVTTFVYLSYTVSIIEQPVMGMVMFESWHDIQYLAIVWMFNVNRARKGPDAGRFTRFLFRPRALLVIAYVGLCLAFGSLAHAWHLFQNDTVIRIVVGLVSATAMFHYYLDGFIWKIREKETGQVLGIAVAEPATAMRRTIPAWATHALLWLLFVVPAALFLVVETKSSRATPLKIYEDLAKSFPDSAKVNDELGRQLVAAGRTREAMEYFRRALASAPQMLQPRLTLGVLLAEEEKFAEAIPHFEYALKLDPENAQVHNQLGMLLGEQGDLSKAKAEIERAISINPAYALAHNNLGIVLRELGNLEQARLHHERAISIDPKTPEFQYQLGLTTSRQGKVH